MIWLWASLAFATEPACPADDPPALAVVLWERRNPAPEFFGIQLGRRLGEREYEMREALLDVLLGLDGLLEPGDRLTILPHGLDPGQAGAEALGSDRGEPRDIYTRLKIAFPSSRDPVRSIHTVVPSGGARNTLGRLIADRVTLPLLQDCPSCPDERGRWGDADTDRALSHPWLLTHNALASAYVEHGYDAPCAEPHEVYLVWVSAGAGTYDPQETERLVEQEIGALAGRWFRGLQSAYRLEPTHQDRLVQVFRVHRAAAGEVELAWVAEEGAASLTEASWWSGSFDSMPLPAWSAPLPAGWAVHGATSHLAWDGGDVEVPVALAVEPGAVRIASPVDLRDAVLAGLGTEVEGQGTFSPTLQTTVQLIPPAGSLYSWTPVAIVEEATVKPPIIRLQRTPVPAWSWAAFAGGFAFVGLVGVRSVGVRVRLRSLAAPVVVEGDSVVDLMPLRDRDTFTTSFRVALEDTSGYRARRASLEVRVSLATFLQPELPLTSTEGFQTLQGEDWEAQPGAIEAHLGAPDGLGFEVVTRHGAIDFGKVTRDELVVVHAIRVEVHDRTGRYADVDATTFHAVRLRTAPGPAEPEAALEITPAAASRWLELRLAGLADDAWAGARRADVGWLVLANPARPRWTPLPVAFHVEEAVAICTPEGAGPEEAVTAEVALRSRDGDLTRVKPGDRRTLVVGVVWPEALRDPHRTRWEIALRVRISADDGSGKITPIPALTRAFRLRTTGRSRSMVLDLGTSATRVLLQDLDEDRWGFLPLGTGEDPADLGAEVRVDGQVTLGEEAAAGTGGRLIPSLKALMLEDGLDAELLQRAVHALLARVHPPLLEGAVTGLRFGERVPLATGPRGQIVALVPEDASPAWRAALSGALATSPAWEGAALLIGEAEAAALWFASGVAAAPPPALPDPPPRLRLLVLDVGAGTTDAALVEVDRPEGSLGGLGRRSLRVLATGGAPSAGRRLDSALSAALGLSGPAVEALRPQLERAKRRLPDHAVTVCLADGTTLSRSAADVLASPAWAEGLDAVAGDALAVLRGRLGHDLRDVHLVVLTGRGALAAGLPQRVEAAAVAHGMPCGRVHRVEKRLLKAAVSLGARLYALGLCGDFVPGQPQLRDRVLLVLSRASGRVEALEMLPSATAEGPWMEVPRFTHARLVRTWMTPVTRAATAPWELDPRRQLAILHGEPLDLGVSAAPFAALPFDGEALSFDRGPVHDLHALVRVVAGPHGIVVEPWSRGHV